MNHPDVGPMSLCGPQLMACQCAKTGPTVRTPKQRADLHAAAVARAQRVKETPTILPLPTEEGRREAHVRFMERQARRGAA